MPLLPVQVPPDLSLRPDFPRTTSSLIVRSVAVNVRLERTPPMPSRPPGGHALPSLRPAFTLVELLW